MKHQEPVNIIQRQADMFITSMMSHEVDSIGLNVNVKAAISKIRSELFEYYKYAQKLEFLERIRYRVKLGWENHNLVCSEKANSRRCPKDEMFENLLFFVQNEIEEVNLNIEPEHLTKSDKENISQLLTKIASDINDLKLSSEFTYNDMIGEFENIKSFYFLDKKTLSQIFIGKLTEMIAGGIVSETVSKKIIEAIKSNYPDLLETLK